MFIYQKNNTYFGQIPDDIKAYGVQELAELGITQATPVKHGVYFTASLDAVMRAVYQSRLFIRILAPLSRFNCRHTDDLYRFALRFPWDLFMTLYDTFAVNATVTDSEITHSKFASLRVKDAIADQFRKRTGRRPSVDTQQPDFSVNLHIHKNTATLSVDLSGGSMHRRGYRIASVPAPMQETLAAAILRISGWKGDKPLYDPMCGSGTFLSEAGMIAAKLPSGYLKKRFGFESLPEFDRDAWMAVRAQADAAVTDIPAGRIAGSDVDQTAVNATRDNLRELRIHRSIRVKPVDFRKLKPITDSIIVCNPPYGKRIGPNDTDMPIDAFYKHFGDFLKQNCKGCTAYIYVGDPVSGKYIGLKSSLRMPLTNGGLDGRLLRYELY